MPEEIMQNIHRIPVPLPGNPLKELNAYLIRGKDRNLLIDTGFRQPACREALFAGLRELGLRRGDVDVLLTHLHSDHAGLAPEAAGETGTIFVSSVDRLTLDNMAERQKYWEEADNWFREEGFPISMMMQIRDKNPARSMAPPTGGHYSSLEDGDVLEAGDYRLQCLLMPGHTPGQMCFWMEREGCMFLGDHVLFDITPNITAWPRMPDALGSYLRSLEKIRAYDVKLALPGHRRGGDMRLRIDQLLEHHKRRLEEAFSAVKNHPGQPAYFLAGKMTWKIRASSWDTFPVAQKWFAVGECMSHLDHLMVQGRIRKELQGGKAAYFAV